MDDKFGVIMILPECAFTSEIKKEDITSLMQDIDDKLTEQGVPEEPSLRSEIMIENALAISIMIGNQEISGNDVAFSNIAYNFLYSFGKVLGFEKVIPLRGITGTFLRNISLINPCLSEIDYQKEHAFFGQQITEHNKSGEDWDIRLSIPPTLH